MNRNGRPLGWLNPKTMPTEVHTIQDIVWAAGIYEGEGNCERRDDCERVYVGQKERWLCDRLRALFGGRVDAVVRPTGMFHRWQIGGARARGFLMSIYGMMSPRRQEQIRTALGK